LRSSIHFIAPASKECVTAYQQRNRTLGSMAESEQIKTVPCCKLTTDEQNLVSRTSALAIFASNTTNTARTMAIA